MYLPVGGSNQILQQGKNKVLNFFFIIVDKYRNSANPRPYGVKAHSRQAKRTCLI
jgi:hypothetical protein